MLLEGRALPRRTEQEFPQVSTSDEVAPVDRILGRYRTFAVVGASPAQDRPSYGVMSVLQRHGYVVIPVNPHVTEILGASCYPDLASIPAPVDVVDIFRRSELAGAHVDEAIAIGAKAVWMQLGVVDAVAGQRARDAGLEVVMDRCPAIELGRRAGEGAST